MHEGKISSVKLESALFITILHFQLKTCAFFSEATLPYYNVHVHAMFM
jgi:hypothetical protein